MKQLECMIAWTPLHPDKPGLRWSGTVGQVKVGPWPDKMGWSTAYALTGGACHSAYHSMPEWQRIAMLFIEFHTLVVRDKIDPQAAHEAFLAIDEYRQKIALDIPGAEE